MSNYRALINPSWVKHIDWLQRRITVDVPRADVMNAPRFDAEQNAGADDEAQVFKYYNRLPYW